MESAKRVEIFSAGVVDSGNFLELMKSVSGPISEITICDVTDENAPFECVEKARYYDVKKFPSLFIDGKKIETERGDETI